MAAVATIQSTDTGHGSFPPRKVSEDVSWFTINGQPVVVDGDMFPAHSDGHSSHTGKAVSTRPWFSIGGKGIVCVGDPVSCGGTIATGDASCQIG